MTFQYLPLAGPFLMVAGWLTVICLSLKAAGAVRDWRKRFLTAKALSRKRAVK